MKRIVATSIAPSLALRRGRDASSLRHRHLLRREPRLCGSRTASMVRRDGARVRCFTVAAMTRADRSCDFYFVPATD